MSTVKIIHRETCGFAPIKALAAVLMLAASMCCGCSGNKDTDRRLAVAEAIMEEHPDSALLILDSIDSASVGGSSRRALYDLLLAEARYKNYIDETDDSLISAACDYFGRNGDDRRLMRALFIKSKIEYNNYNLSESVISNLKAEKLAKKADDKLYLARICEHFSLIYLRNYNVEAQLPYLHAAHDYYMASGKMRSALFALVGLCNAYNNLERYDKSIMLSDSLLNVVEATDTVLQIFMREVRIESLLCLERKSEASSELEHVRRLNHNDFSDDYLTPFNVYITLDDLKTAKIYMDSILLSPDNASKEGEKLVAQLDYYKAVGNDAEALKYAKKYIYNQYKESLKQLSQNVMRAKSDYYASEEKAASSMARRNWYWFMASAVLIFLVIFGSIIYNRHKLRVKRLELQLKMDEITRLLDVVQLKNKEVESVHNEANSQFRAMLQLQDRIEEKNGELSEMENVVGELYKNQFRILNTLCREYYVKKDASAQIRNTLYKDFENIIAELQASRSFQKLEDSLDKYCDGLASKLRVAMPYLKRIDRKILILIFSGMSGNAICVICDIERGNYYVKRQRLRDKIEKLDSPYRELFLSKMGMDR